LVVPARSVCNIITNEYTAFPTTFTDNARSLSIFFATIPFLTAVRKCRILNVLIVSSGYWMYLLDEFWASPLS